MGRFGPPSDGGVIYSSDQGALCPRCGVAANACVCRTAAGTPASSGAVRVSRETKGRKGKGATVITGLPLGAAALAALASELKRTLGTGGTVRDGVIEVQGDHRDAVVEFLAARGHRARRVGG